MEETSEPAVDVIPVNIAFEKMLSAAVTTAMASGGLSLLIGLAGVVFGAISVGGVLNILVSAMFASITTFLIGFGASVVFGAPLFILLEKQKRRTLWPWLCASLAVAAAVFILAPGGFAVDGGSFAIRAAAIFLPALVFAIMFVRGIAPHWQAAARPEAAAAGSSVVRLH